MEFLNKIVDYSGVKKEGMRRIIITILGLFGLLWFYEFIPLLSRKPPDFGSMVILTLVILFFSFCFLLIVKTLVWIIDGFNKND